MNSRGIEHAKATRRLSTPNGLHIVRTVDAILGSPKIDGDRTERIAYTAGHFLGQARISCAHLWRRVPIGPRLLVANHLGSRPAEALTPNCDGVLVRAALLQDEVEFAPACIDYDGIDRKAVRERHYRGRLRRDVRTRTTILHWFGRPCLAIVVSPWRFLDPLPARSALIVSERPIEVATPKWPALCHAWPAKRENENATESEAGEAHGYCASRCRTSAVCRSPVVHHLASNSIVAIATKATWPRRNMIAALAKKLMVSCPFARMWRVTASTGSVTAWALGAARTEAQPATLPLSYRSGCGDGCPAHLAGESRRGRQRLCDRCPETARC